MTDQMTSPVEGTVEEIQTPAAVTPPAKDPNEKRWAHMAKQERMLRAERQKLTAEREAFLKDKEEADKYRTWQSRLSQQDFSALQEAGVTNEQLTNYLVNQPNPTDREITLLKQKLQALEEGQGTIKKSIDESRTEAYQQALTQIRSDAGEIAKADLERYELVNANFEDAVEAATLLVESHFNETGKMIPIESALNDVEEYYLEAILGAAQKSKKIQSKLMPPPPPAEKLPPPSMGKIPFSSAVRDAARPAPTTRTLTHQQIPLPAEKAPLSPKDRRARAIAAFNSQKT